MLTFSPLNLANLLSDVLDIAHIVTKWAIQQFSKVTFITCTKRFRVLRYSV